MPPFPDGTPSEPLRRRRRSEASGFPPEQDEQDSWSAFGPPAPAAGEDSTDDPGGSGRSGSSGPAQRARGQGAHGGHAAEDPSAGGGGMPWWARRDEASQAQPWLPPTPAAGNPSVGTPASGVTADSSASGWPPEEPGASRREPEWTEPTPAWPGRDDPRTPPRQPAWEAGGWPAQPQEDQSTWPAAEPSWPSSEPAWGSDQSWSAPPEPAWPSTPDIAPLPDISPLPARAAGSQPDPGAGGSSWSGAGAYPQTYGGASRPPEAWVTEPEPPSDTGAWSTRTGAWAEPVAEVPVGWPQDVTAAPGMLDRGPAETGPLDVATALPPAAPSTIEAPEPALRVIRAAEEPAGEVPQPFLIPLAQAQSSATEPGDTASVDPDDSSRPDDRSDAAATALLGAVADQEGTSVPPLASPERVASPPPSSRRGRREPAPGAAPPRAGRNLPASIAVSLGLGATVAASLFFRKEIFIAVAGVAMVVALWELSGAFAAKRIVVPVIPLAVGAAGMLVSAFVAGEEGLIVSFTLTAFGVVLWRIIDGVEGAARDIAASVFAAAYVPFLASFAVLMVAEDDGPMRVITFILVVFASDTGGYIAGVLFGKHPMAPKVSPKKSWEGFAGSTIGCLVMGAVTVTQLLDGDLVAGLALGAAAVVTATMGDLGESLIKRDLGIKDMSNILPGHGGVMDRMDSLLATAPVACLLLAWLVPVAV